MGYWVQALALYNWAPKCTPVSPALKREEQGSEVHLPAWAKDCLVCLFVCCFNLLAKCFQEKHLFHNGFHKHTHKLRRVKRLTLCSTPTLGSTDLTLLPAWQGHLSAFSSRCSGAKLRPESRFPLSSCGTLKGMCFLSYAPRR